MKWEGGRRSANVDDRRGRSGRGVKLGAGGAVVVIVIAVVMTLMGKDPSGLLSAVSGGAGGSSSAGGAPPPGQDRLADFVSVVLADTEDTWSGIFAQRGQRYAPPTLVLFRDQVRSACGLNSAAVGPFYCPGDRKVYIDLSFFEELDSRFGAPGDFAQAYVLGHEVGHHLQTLLGTSTQVRARQRGMPEAQKNALSVALELQADCYAGVWAHHADQQRQLLEDGDVEEGLRAAAAIGDDTLQRRAGARVSPESWTHGSSEQRARWLRVGLRTGDMNACDTFSGGR